MYRFSIYKDETTFPVTEHISDCEITLPMHGMLSEDDVQYICDCVKEVINDL